MAITDHILFLYRNWIDGAALSASSQGTPAARLKDFRPGRAWQATGCADEWIVADLGAERMCSHAAVIAHNEDANGTIQVQAAADGDPAFSAPLYDVTQDAQPCITDFGDGYFGESIDGSPVLDGENDPQPMRVFDFGGNLFPRYVRFRFVNPTLAGGVIRVGRLFVGDGYQPTYNFAYDWEIDDDDQSEITQTQSSVFVTKRAKPRLVKLSLPFIPEAEAIRQVRLLKRTVGQSKDFIMIPFPNGSNLMQYETSVYGMQNEKAGLSNPHFQLYSSSFSVRELVR